MVSALLGLTIGELGWAGLCVLLLVLAVGVVVSGSDERLEERLWCAERGGGEGGVGGLGGGQTAAGHANSCWYLERMNAMSAGGGLASAAWEGRWKAGGKTLSKCALATALPVYCMNATWSGSHTSNVVDRTLDR